GPYWSHMPPRTMIRVDFAAVAGLYARAGRPLPDYDEIWGRFGLGHDDSWIRWHEGSRTLEIGYPSFNQLSYQNPGLFGWLVAEAEALLPVVGQASSGSAVQASTEHAVFQVFGTDEGRAYLVAGRAELTARYRRVAAQFEAGGYA